MTWVDPTGYPTKTQQKPTCLRIPAQSRKVFEAWIEEELTMIRNCVDSLLADSGVQNEAIDEVFLTGGSSFVPAVRRIFEDRFGSGKIQTGNEFTSVAHGLALKAAVGLTL